VYLCGLKYGYFSTFQSYNNILINIDKNTKIRSSQEVDVLNDLIIDAIQDIKGKNIVKIDLTKVHDAPAEYFIICEGDSIVQVRGIAENVMRRVKTELSQNSFNKEGVLSSRWILLDYFQTVVHVFYPEARAFYDLEDLWSDGKRTEYANL